MHQIMYSQTLGGRWYDSDVFISIPDTRPAVHCPCSRIAVEMWRPRVVAVKMRQQWVVHIGECNCTLSSMGKVRGNVLPLCLSADDYHDMCEQADAN